MEIEFITLHTGNLLIVVTDHESVLDAKERAEKQNAKNVDEWVMSDIMDTSGYIGSDWYCNPVFALFDGFTICKGGNYHTEESDDPEEFNYIWIDKDNYKRSLLDELLKRGYIELEKVRE